MIKVQIQSIRYIQGGVEVLARALVGGKQVGFGLDGSVDIERFRFFGNKFLKDRLISESRLKEMVVDTIRVKKEVHDDKRIITNKIGNTTSTFYPAAGAVSPVDGKVGRQNVNESFASLISGAGTSADSTGISPRIFLQAEASTDLWKNLEHFIMLFDTSAISDTDVISSATVSLYGFASADAFGESVGIVGSTPAANDTLATTDYINLGTTRYASDIAIASLSTSAYNDWVLNATGIAAISKTGITKLGAKLASAIDEVAPTWGANLISRFNFYSADQTGTSQDPKLVVEHAAAPSSPAKTFNTVAAAAQKTINGVSIANVKSINTIV